MQYMSQPHSSRLCADSLAIGNMSWDELGLVKTPMQSDNLKLANGPAPDVLSELRFKANHGEGRANRP
jgi:hypothetical protein